MEAKEAVYQSIAQIERRIAEKLTVENLAAGVHFSKYHYGRLFREIVGESVMNYVNRRRLTLAGELLLNSKQTVLTIALALGFGSHEGFTRAFHAFSGVTPSEYRKYRLATLPQKIGKGSLSMIHLEETTNLLCVLNEMTAAIRETAEAARKCPVPHYSPFWENIAAHTDKLAEELQEELAPILRVAESPDSIAGRFEMIKAAEDVAFSSNLLSFQVHLMVARGNETDRLAHAPLCERFSKLARACSLGTSQISQLLNSLSAAIFADIRKTAREKLTALAAEGEKAAMTLDGADYRYNYIQLEIEALTAELRQSLAEQVTVKQMEDWYFRLRILCLAAEEDIFRTPQHRACFEALHAFCQHFREETNWFSQLLPVDCAQSMERTSSKHFNDIAFQGNILLFYTRGEMEKLGSLLREEQKVAFMEICEKINTMIGFAVHATESSAYPVIADQLMEIAKLLHIEADTLLEKGGAVRFLAEQQQALEKAVRKCIG